MKKKSAVVNVCDFNVSLQLMLDAAVASLLNNELSFLNTVLLLLQRLELIIL
jgi:hypothetical protein